MTRDEARRMEAQINAEPGWHAEMMGPNSWTGQYSVEAWQGDGAPDSDDRENCYHLRFLADWYRLRAGLRAEAEEQMYNHHGKSCGCEMCIQDYWMEG